MDASSIADEHYSNISNIAKRDVKSTLVFGIFHFSSIANFGIANAWLRALPLLHLIPKLSSFATSSAILPEFRDRVWSAAARTDMSAIVCQMEDIVRKTKKPFILFDIGGYFAPYADKLADQYESQLRLVIEDTGNGHLRYLGTRLGKTSRYLSLADSPAKMAENVMVGRIIADVAFRRGLVDPSKHYIVNGYGRIGRSLAVALKSLGTSRVWVRDTDPVRATMAVLEGFNGLSLGAPSHPTFAGCFSMTGQNGFDDDVADLIEPNGFVTTVTSFDDELAPELCRRSGGDMHRAPGFILNRRGGAIRLIDSGKPLNLSAGAATDGRNAALHLLFGQALSSIFEHLPSLLPDAQESETA